MRFWSFQTTFRNCFQGRSSHLYIGIVAVLIAYLLLLIPLPSQSSCPRQQIPGVTPGLSFLDNPTRQRHPVDTYSEAIVLLPRAALELSRSWFLFGAELRVSLFAGRLRGCHRVNSKVGPAPTARSSNRAAILHVHLDQANNPRRLVYRYDDSDVSSIAYPYSAQLDGVPGWVPSYRLSFPLHGLMISRYRGESASPQHPGDRNCTYTENQVIKDLRLSP